MGLYQLNLWEFVHFKDTVIWGLFTGTYLLFKSVASATEGKQFSLKETLRDNFKFVVLLHFLINTYTFSLIGELLFIPFMVCVGVVKTTTGLREDQKMVSTAMGWIEVMVGLLLIYLSAVHFSDYSKTMSLETDLKGICLPFLFTLFLAPYLHFWSLYSSYEVLFLRLKLQSKAFGEDVLQFGKREIFMACGLSLWKVKKLSVDSELRPKLFRATTRAEYREVLSESLRV
jgi:hypothetical protein